MKKVLNRIILMIFVSICTIIISCTQKPPRAFDTSQVKQIDSIVESKVNPTFDSVGQYEQYVLNQFDQSSIPIIYMGDKEAFDMCVGVSLKKYGHINNKLFSQEWNKNYKNIYRYYESSKKDSSKIPIDTLASVNVTKE